MKKRNAILIVDDSVLSRKTFSSLLCDDYILFSAGNAVQAIDLLHAHTDEIALILLDIIMPGMDGFQMLAIMSREHLIDQIPVVLITATERDKYVALGYDLGACDIIQKPYNPHVAKRRIKNIIELYAHKNNLEATVKQQAKKLATSSNNLIEALSTVIEYRNLESGQHVRRIRNFTELLLRQVARECPQYNLCKESIRDISSASVMHDVGKIAIPDFVLLKPGKLTPEEFDIMKTHTTKGHEILRHLRNMENIRYISYCYDISLYHHERWNGKGYPMGISEDEIPICAQAVSIADVYDALTHQRVYKSAYSHKIATEMIMEEECGLFSPCLLHCFQSVLESFESLSAAYEDHPVK